MEQKIIDDIGKFYAHKVHNLTVDTIDSCDRMELSGEKTAMMVVSVLANELLNLAVAIDMEEEHFIRLCTMGFRKVAAHER